MKVNDFWFQKKTYLLPCKVACCSIWAVTGGLSNQLWLTNLFMRKKCSSKFLWRKNKSKKLEPKIWFYFFHVNPFNSVFASGSSNLSRFTPQIKFQENNVYLRHSMRSKLRIRRRKMHILSLIGWIKMWK